MGGLYRQLWTEQQGGEPIEVPLGVGAASALAAVPLLAHVPAADPRQSSPTLATRERYAAGPRSRRRRRARAAARGPRGRARVRPRGTRQRGPLARALRARRLRRRAVARARAAPAGAAARAHARAPARARAQRLPRPRPGRPELQRAVLGQLARRRAAFDSAASVSGVDDTSLAAAEMRRRRTRLVSPRPHQAAVSRRGCATAIAIVASVAHPRRRTGRSSSCSPPPTPSPPRRPRCGRAATTPLRPSAPFLDERRRRRAARRRRVHRPPAALAVRGAGAPRRPRRRARASPSPAGIGMQPTCALLAADHAGRRDRRDPVAAAARVHARRPVRHLGRAAEPHAGACVPGRPRPAGPHLRERPPHHRRPAGDAHRGAARDRARDRPTAVTYPLALPGRLTPAEP